MRRRPTVHTATACAVAVAATACAVPVEEKATRVDRRDVPFHLLDRDAPPLIPPTTAGATGEPVQLCFVRDGRLVFVERLLQAPVDPDDALAALAAPPEEGDAARTALTEPDVVSHVTVFAGVARVDLKESISELGGDDQLLAVAQIVCTLTARPGVGQVSFALEGAPVDVPRGDGSLVAQPVSREDYRTLLP